MNFLAILSQNNFLNFELIKLFNKLISKAFISKMVVLKKLFLK